MANSKAEHNRAGYAKRKATKKACSSKEECCDAFCPNKVGMVLGILLLTGLLLSI